MKIFIMFKFFFKLSISNRLQLKRLKVKSVNYLVVKKVMKKPSDLEQKLTEG